MRGCIDPKSITVSSLPFPVLHGSAPEKNNKFTLIYTATFSNQPSLNAQSCNTRPLYSTFTFENVRSQFFLTPKTWKTCPQKLLVIGPKLFIFVLARLFKQPRNRKLVPPKAPQCRTVYLEWGNHATLPLPFCNVGVCGHGRLYRWMENSFPFFLYLKPVEISKKCFNIIWTSL